MTTLIVISSFILSHRVSSNEICVILLFVIINREKKTARYLRYLVLFSFPD